jgi:hypothetical protein
MSNYLSGLEPYYDNDPSPRELCKVNIDFVVSNYGEIIPFSLIARLSLHQFNDVNGMADALGSSGSIPPNHLYAELTNGQRCILDIDNTEFQNGVNINEYGIYLAPTQLKDLVIKTYVRQYERNQKNVKRSNFNQATVEPAV